MDDTPAVNRMDGPKGGIEECEVGDENVVRVHQLNKMTSGVIQCSIPP